MSIEIERKYLVKSDNYKTPLSSKMYIKQGYFKDGVRVRITKNNKSQIEYGYITFKSTEAKMSRSEFEYKIPYSEAKEILNTLCTGPIIEKNRYITFYNGNRWEIDEFFGDNEGLIIAEIELDSEGQKFKVPDWLGEEVTHLKKYYNSHLTKNPYNKW